jgi:hypothetical protein
VKRLRAKSSATLGLVLALLGMPASGTGAPAREQAIGPELTAAELAADLVAGRAHQTGAAQPRSTARDGGEPCR